MSYGSQTQRFNDLVNTLNQFTGYNPSNPTLKIAGLQTSVSQLTTLNNTVIQKYNGLQTSRSNRNALYIDLKDRMQRAKAYVRAQYGSASKAYKFISGIAV